MGLSCQRQRRFAMQGQVCIDHNIPVLIEKPITNNLTEAAKLVTASEAADVPILVGHHRRFNPIIERAHQMIIQGAIGDVKAVHATCWFYKPDSYFDKAPWRKKKAQARSRSIWCMI